MGQEHQPESPVAPETAAPSTPTHRLRVGVAWLLSVGVALGLTFWAADVAWVPPGPQAEDPGYGQGSDWDRRWQWASVGRAAQQQRRIAWWDPFQNYGQPQFSEPENFLLHPAYMIGTVFGGAHGGFHALMLFCCFALFGGLGLLGQRLGIPPPLAMVTGLIAVCSPEWTLRLYSGHIMFLGICLWPAFLVVIDRALDREISSSRAVLGWAALGGVLLAVAGLTGGHYPLPFGLLLASVMIWTSASTALLNLLLLSTLLVALSITDAPPSARYGLDLLLGLTLFAGLWKGGRLRQQATVVCGIGLGLLAGGGAFFVSALKRGSELGLGFGAGAAHEGNLIRVTDLFRPNARMEGLIHVPSPGWWVLAALGLLFLARRSPPLAVAGAAAWCVGWSLGKPLLPWEIIGLIPGMDAAGSIDRLQWIVLILPPMGLALGLTMGTERWLGKTGSWFVALLVVALGFQALSPHYMLKQHRPPPPVEQLPSEPGRVHRASTESSSIISSSMYSGVVLPNRGSELQLPPPEAAERAWWVLRDGRPTSETSGITVQGVLDRWTLEGPPGTVLRLAQRDLAGWRCSGAQILQGFGPQSPDPALDWWWLTVQLNETGLAECEWRPPGLRVGLGLQFLALLCLLAIFLRRRPA
jgi:hypothetical protein